MGEKKNAYVVSAGMPELFRLILESNIHFYVFMVYLMAP
jgi:hypothetical protein